MSSRMDRHDRMLDFSALSTVVLAHDLQNLLAIMAGCVDSLEGRTVGLSEADRDLAVLNEAIDSAFGLARELLAVVGRQQASEPLLIDVHELLQRYRGMLQRLVGASVQLVVTTADTSGLLIEANPVQLEWVLLNLAANGRDAMPRGGVVHIETASIERWIGPAVGQSRRARFLRLTVRDQGAGLTEDAKVRLFEPFFTTSHLGTGLGLTSVAVTVRALKGWLFLESAEPAGTSVHVILPLYTEPAGTPPAAPSN
jgi:signal transduction histidine kinase